MIERVDAIAGVGRIANSPLYEDVLVAHEGDADEPDQGPRRSCHLAPWRPPQNGHACLELVQPPPQAGDIGIGEAAASTA